MNEKIMNQNKQEQTNKQTNKHEWEKTNMNQK